MNTVFHVRSRKVVEAIAARNRTRYENDHADFIPLCNYDPKFHRPYMLGGPQSNIIKADFRHSEDPLDPEPTLRAA